MVDSPDSNWEVDNCQERKRSQAFGKEGTTASSWASQPPVDEYRSRHAFDRLRDGGMAKPDPDEPVPLAAAPWRDTGMMRPAEADVRGRERARRRWADAHPSAPGRRLLHGLSGFEVRHQVPGEETGGVIGFK